jgi:hypothetical protein
MISAMELPTEKGGRSWPIVKLSILPVLFILGGSGCTTVQQGGPQRTPLMEAVGSKANALDLRAMDNLLAISVPGTIETAADAIKDRSPDPAVKRRALLWKVEIIPAFQQALFYADPLAAALDAWSLSIQIEQALETEAMRESFGPLRPLAVDAARQIRVQIEAAAKATAKTPEGFERAKATLERWARAHPIVGTLSSRPSILTYLADLSAGGLDVSVFQVMANIPSTIADLATRMDIYAAYLPKAARWHMELAAGDLADRTDAQRVLATLESVQKLTERSNALLSPAGLRGAMDTAIGQVRGERVAALASVDQQRVETLAYLTKERAAAVADLDRERVAFAEQLEVLRKQALSDVDDLTARIIRRVELALAVLLVLAAALTLAVLALAPRLRARRSTETS